MSLRYRLPTSLEYFASLVQSDAHFPLLEAAASLAQDEYPELDMQQFLSEMNQLIPPTQHLRHPHQRLSDSGPPPPPGDSDFARRALAGTGPGLGLAGAGRCVSGAFHGQGALAQ